MFGTLWIWGERRIIRAVVGLIGCEGLDGKGMNVRVGRVLGRVVKFTHEYDFGSTTDLALKVVSQRVGVSGDSDVVLLARNDPPQTLCLPCGQPAKWIHVFRHEAFCDKCARGRAEGELLPIVNSPRVGVCGYAG